MDLFEYAKSRTMENESPLASRLRPTKLEEVVGQQHIVGKDKLLYRAIKADKLTSVIFYGPPGTGKTTLAKVIANTTSADFTQINATVAGKKDMEEVVGMMRVFYDSPAVIHAAPDEILRQDVKDCVGDCPYIEGYIFEENDRILGYSMVAKSYSTEYGGICVWVEDLYMKEEARGLGIGTAFFSFLDEKYKDQAVRFRLEVEEENERAVAVYKKAGYHPLPYMQMTKEQS